MQHVAVHLSHFSSRGGRVSSPALRHSQQLSEDFAGLPAGTDHYDLLLLVKKAGRAAGFTPRMIILLDYYYAFTRHTDWQAGNRPVVYQSLAKTALDLGVSERQVQRLEQALFEAGALTWNDTGNHRRHGQRCAKTGRILYAYGVDLSPLAALKGKLEAKLQEKTLRDQAWLETKRQISAQRRQVCALLAEAEAGCERPAWLCEAAGRYEALAVPIRTYMDLAALRELLSQTQALLDWLSEKASPPGDGTVVHYHSFTQESEESVGAANGFQESVAVPSQPSVRHRAAPNRGEGRQGDFGTGLQLLNPKQALNAASERFRAHVPMHPRPVNWSDLVEAAYRLKPELRISQTNWGEACQTLGRHGAAVCLLLTDQAMLRPDDPVRQPGAYFRAMIHRAQTGELNLQGSVFGLLKREKGDGGRRRTDPPTAAWRRGLTRPLSDRSAPFHVPLRRLRRTCLFAPTVRKQPGQASGCVTAAGSWRWSLFAGSAHGRFRPRVGVTAVIPPLFCREITRDHATAADAGQTRRLPPGGTSLTRPLSDRSTPFHAPLRRLRGTFHCVPTVRNSRDSRDRREEGAPPASLVASLLAELTALPPEDHFSLTTDPPSPHGPARRKQDERQRHPAPRSVCGFSRQRAKGCAVASAPAVFRSIGSPPFRAVP